MTHGNVSVYYPRTRMYGNRQTRWSVLLVLCSAMAAHAAMGWGQAKTPNKHDLRAAVESADQRWRTAQFNNDVPAMEKLLSDDYLGISGNGQVLTKTQQLDRMRTHMTALTRLDLSDEKVKIIGNIAIVTSEAALEGTIDGHPIHGLFRSTRVYKRVAGSWKLTSFEGTPEREHGDHGPGNHTAGEHSTHMGC